MKKIIYIVIALIAIISCKNDEVAISDYVELSMLSYSFSDSGPDSVIVGVKSNVDWSAESDNEKYFPVEKVGEDSLIIRSIPTENGSSVRGAISFVAGTAKAVFNADRLQKYFKGNLMDYETTSRGAVSLSGKYAAYIYEYMDESGRFASAGYKINLETRDMESLEIPPLDEYYRYNEISGISDDGQTIMFTNNENAITDIYRNGEKLTLSTPEGSLYPNVNGMSADGTIFVGTVRMQGTYIPVKWADSGAEYELLENPEQSAGGDGTWPGTIPRGCSADGSVIYGSEWRHQGLVYWKDGVLHNLGVEYGKCVQDPNNEYKYYISRIVQYSDNNRISPNGKYIASSYIDFDSEYQETECPVLINTETGEVDFLTEVPMAAGTAVTDDGLMFGGTPTLGISYGLVFDFEARTSIPISDWFLENKGLVIEDNRIVCKIPNDKVYFGYRMQAGGTGPIYPYWHLVIE